MIIKIVYSIIGLTKEREDCSDRQISNDREGTTIPGTIEKDVRGAYHTILKLGMEQKIETLFNDDDLLKIYLCDILPHSVGKQKWNVCSKNFKMSAFVTISDEAFALLTIENGAPKWMDELDNPNKDKRDTAKTVYTQGSDSCGTPGWSEEGIDRFLELIEHINVIYKNSNGEHKKKCDEIVRREFYKGGTLKKRDREIVQRLKETGTINDGGLCVRENERRKKRTRQLLNVMSNVYDDDDVGESQITNFDAV